MVLSVGPIKVGHKLITKFRVSHEVLDEVAFGFLGEAGAVGVVIPGRFRTKAIPIAGRASHWETSAIGTS